MRLCPIDCLVYFLKFKGNFKAVFMKIIGCCLLQNTGRILEFRSNPSCKNLDFNIQYHIEKGWILQIIIDKFKRIYFFLFYLPCLEGSIYFCEVFFVNISYFFVYLQSSHCTFVLFVDFWSYFFIVFNIFWIKIVKFITDRV